MAEKKQNETEKKQIELVVGQPVQITLQSMAGSTGYSWFLTKLSGGLALSDTTSVPTATIPGQIAPINQIFSFLAISKGTYEIEFNLIAPWRPDDTADTEKYDVKIEEPKKAAAEDIESAMKGREFISASAVNVGAAGVIKYAAPMAQPVLKYAAPMASCSCYCGPVMVPPYAAPISQVQPLYAAPMSQAQATYTPVRPTTYAYIDPCLDPRNSMLAANTMIAYAAPVGPSTVAAMDPCLDPRNSVLAANTMIAYAAPIGPSTAAAMGINSLLQQRQYMDPSVAAANILYAAPMVRTQPSVAAANILYVAPMVRPQPYVAAANILYAAPISQGQMVCATQMMPPYAAPYTFYGCY